MHQDDIPASDRDMWFTLNYAWKIIIAGTKTVEVKARKEAGATATVNTFWQRDKATVLKVNP
jgi:hypothetical protein